MQHSNKSSGSALLLVLIITSLLMFVALASWRTSSLCSDLVTERENYSKQLYAMELMFNAALKLIASRYDEIIKKRHYAFTVSSRDLPLQQGQVQVTRLGMYESLHVLLTLQSSKESSHQLRCLFVRQEFEKGKRFVVSHYTVGSTV